MLDEIVSGAKLKICYSFDKRKPKQSTIVTYTSYFSFIIQRNLKKTLGGFLFQKHDKF